MTNEQSIPSHDPTAEALVVWTDDTGHDWPVTTHWAEIDGRLVMVGLDIRSFLVSHDGERRPWRGSYREVTQAVLRGLPISRVRGEVVDRRRRYAEGMAAVAEHYWWDGKINEEAAVARKAARESVTRSAPTTTAAGAPRKRRPAVTDGTLRRVAELYAEAVNDHGEKHPAKYVEHCLRREGEPLPAKSSDVLVRQWIRRARNRGYLTIPPHHSRRNETPDA